MNSTTSADASVGVLMPVTMLATRNTMPATMGSTPAARRHQARDGRSVVAGGLPEGAGPSATRSARAAAMTAAGSSPPKNSAPTERVVIDPRTSRAMLGGIVSPIAAEAASTAALSARRYPRSSQMASSARPTAAMSALFEPDSPEKTYIVAMMAYRALCRTAP